MQSFVQFIHELRRRGVADFPQSRYNVVRPSAKKSPSQTNKPFPRVGFHSSPITRGNGYQVGVPWVLDDVARIKLVCTAFRRKNHRRFEGTNGTGGPVRREVQIGKCLGFSREKLGRNSLCARKHRPPVRSEMALHQPHFLARLRKRRKIRARLERVTHQKEVRLLWRKGWGSLSQQRQRVPC